MSISSLGVLLIVFTQSSLVHAAPRITPVGGNLRITPAMLKFQYQDFDGIFSINCVHAVETAESQDWKVTCTNGPKTISKQFSVHLWVTQYPRPSDPRVSYEILYWVTDLSNPHKPTAASSTIWVHLKDPSELSGLELAQGVDEDTAGLYLTINPLGFRNSGVGIAPNH